MAFDYNLIKVTTVGLVFLLLLAYFNYYTYSKPQVVIETHTTTCYQCESRLRDIERSYRRQIDQLNTLVKEKETEITNYRIRHVTPTCPDNTVLKNEYDRLVVRIQELESSKSEYDRTVNELELCKRAYREFKAAVDARTQKK